MSEALVIDPTRPEDYAFNDRLVDAVQRLGHQVVSRIHPHELLDRSTSEPNWETIEQINRFSHIIYGGVPVTRHYPYATAKDLQPSIRTLISEVKVPMFFICAGFQGLCLQKGAKIIKNKEIQEGLCYAEVIPGQEKDPIFKYVDKAESSNGFEAQRFEPVRFQIASYHKASAEFDEESAPELIWLASSPLKLNVSMGCEKLIVRVRVAGTQIYGDQSHPELSPGRPLLRGFLELSASSESRIPKLKLLKEAA